MNRWILATAATLLSAGFACAGAKDDLMKTWEKGAKALSAAQTAEGAWTFDGKNGDVAATGLAVAALAGGPADLRKAYEAAIAKGCEYLLKNQAADGKMHNEGSVPLLTNYKTAIAVMALAKADSAKYADAIKKGATWLTNFQYQEGGSQKAGPDDPNFGGAGYDEKNNQPRGDLSNTAYMLEALESAGVPKDSDVWKRAVKFVERCQNRSESNDGPGFDKMNVVVGDDGGFFYRPGESKAERETLPNGKQIFRSYGSMTYAGYRSMIYAGLGADDPRVKLALGWIAKHYTLDENPNMGVKGLYYYYHVFASALDAGGQAELKDAEGEKHLWAEELTAKLAALQGEDGTWKGDPKWMEDVQPLPACYSLMALNHAAKYLK
ncbi:MAG: terpene cyclase/mutase family protein [Planctomycetes bacterium]|nr:terpene cyclase/mutase family protein [Planctomycetota bacterium]